MLFKEYGRKILVILDEYDVSLQKSIIAKEPYYDRMLEIIRQISVHTFKQNPDQWLFKGIVTGCLKIAHQSIFTDANNFVTYSIEESAFSGFFGFTDTETKKILIDCDLVSREQDLRDWYDGYRLGSERLYCPWSVTSFCSSCINISVNHEAQSY